MISAYDELAEVCAPRGIAQELRWGMPLRDRALIELGEVERGLAQMEASLQAHTVTRSTLLRPYYLVLYAGALLRAGQFDAAARALAEGATNAEETSQSSYDAEHARLQAEVHRAMDRPADAEASYQRALDVSRRQGAKWLELRASRGYADFLSSTGRTTEARALLEPIVSWFTEGRETIDYRAAEDLLRRL